MANTIAIRLASTKGNLVGIFWTIGWESGRIITNTEAYEDWYRNVWHPYRFQKFGY